MEDNFNTGGTHYEDATGKEISEQEYRKLQGPEKSGADDKVKSTVNKDNKK